MKAYVSNLVINDFEADKCITKNDTISSKDLGTHEKRVVYMLVGWYINDERVLTYIRKALGFSKQEVENWNVTIEKE